MKDPHVLVTVLEYRKTTFSILGQVARPGIYEIPEGTHMSIVDAILLAGGFTRIAAQNGVRVKRMVKGKPTVFKVHAGAMADSSDVAPFRNPARRRHQGDRELVVIGSAPGSADEIVFRGAVSSIGAVRS